MYFAIGLLCPIYRHIEERGKVHFWSLMAALLWVGSLTGVMGGEWSNMRAVNSVQPGPYMVRTAMTPLMCVYITVFLVMNGSIVVDIKLYLHSLEESRVRVRHLDNVYRQSCCDWSRAPPTPKPCLLWGAHTAETEEAI